MNVEGYFFPDHYYFWTLDPNGGIWLKKTNQSHDLQDKTLENNCIYRLGVSSLIASKLKVIKSFQFKSSTSNMMEIENNKPFIRIYGKNLNMVLFAPFTAEIHSINSNLEGKLLTGTSIYQEHWLLEIMLPFSLNITSLTHWYECPHKAISMYVNRILKFEKSIQDDCCPDLKKSSIIYRKNNNPDV